MHSTQKVIKNSFWLIIQPLILNVISLFVIGYIASSLGQVAYGKFIFAFSFVSMFASIANMGLGSIITRDISEQTKRANYIVGNIVLLRFFLGCVAFLIVVAVINLMQYPGETKLIVYIAGLTLIFNAVATTFYSVFQGFEKMEYVSYSQFISGFILTVLSVLVLLLGYRLVGLTIVYCLGSFLMMMLASGYCFKKCTMPLFKVDFLFWKQYLVRGMPFFLPAMINLFGTKIGFIFLSKIGGDTSVGVYGAANSLIERLSVIPDSVGTAIFPAIASLYLASQEEAAQLFKTIIRYMILIALPIAVGTTILAKQIILLIYGVKYHDSTIILQILIWNFFIGALASLVSWSLAAIHQEKKTAILSSITTILYIFCGLLFINKFREIGFAIANVVVGIITLIMLYLLAKKVLVKELISSEMLIKLLICNLIMGISIIFMARINFFLAFFSGVMLYAGLVFKFKVLNWGDIVKLQTLIFSKNHA